jgi:simple sugar transport system ATP-binding protein
VTALLALENVGKRFGSIDAVSDVTFSIEPGRVCCLLGDNGAGKSTVIKLLSGVHTPSTGRILWEGQHVTFTSPANALQRGIATVYQDLALVPLLSVWRNFFLGRERTVGPFRRLDVATSARIALDHVSRMGVELRDAAQPVATLSGGERQCVAVARAAYFGARVLILDEPTAALGVRQVAIVLRTIAEARQRGLAVLLVTHNPVHAHAAGDDFVILRRGAVAGKYQRGDVTPSQLAELVS